VTSEAMHFKFDHFRACLSPTATNRPWKGRGQDHASNFKILHALKYLWNGWSYSRQILCICSTLYQVFSLL